MSIDEAIAKVEERIKIQEDEIEWLEANHTEDLSIPAIWVELTLDSFSKNYRLPLTLFPFLAEKAFFATICCEGDANK